MNHSQPQSGRALVAGQGWEQDLEDFLMEKYADNARVDILFLV